MEQPQKNDGRIDLPVEQADKAQPDYTPDIEVASQNTQPLADFPLKESVVKSENSPEDVAKAAEETSK